MWGYARDRVQRGAFILRVIPIAVLAGCGTMAAKRTDPMGERVGSEDATREQAVSPPTKQDSYVVNGRRYHTLKTAHGFRETGVASWYGWDFHGKRTSSGEIYDMYQMTAAHKHLPLPTYVNVRNLFNGRSVIVKVNDRGPFFAERVIDLSYAAALKLDIAVEGTGLVKIHALEHENKDTPGHELHAAPSAEQRQKGVVLQIGAFRNWTNAERLRIEVSRVLKRAAHIQNAFIANKAFYRVHIGPFQDAELVNRVRPALSRLGLHAYRLLSN